MTPTAEVTKATRLTFLGAADTVTGSRYLVDHGDDRTLVDCGLFQGLKRLRLRNREPFPVAPESIDRVVLTHAHLDHSGYLPALIRDGFAGPVHATESTCDLLGILLPDSGFLQEMEAERANRKGYSKHSPAVPLYTRADAEASLGSLAGAPFGQALSRGPSSVLFRRAGHILGAASIECTTPSARIVFSGDLGRPNDPVMHDPEPVPEADYLVVESTYGDRGHPDVDPRSELGRHVAETASRGGVVVIPSFAVGRAQTVLHHLAVLKKQGEIPDIPIFLDSPMAADATSLYRAHPDDHRLTSSECADAFRSVTITHTPDESKAIDRRNGPMVVISASGMATGGRVLFHLARFAPDHRNSILLVGHQAPGTRGDRLVRGEERLKIHGRWVQVEAEVHSISGLSAHADADEILDWLRGFRGPPKRTFVTHGDPRAADTLRFRIEEELGWEAADPEHGETVLLE